MNEYLKGNLILADWLENFFWLNYSNLGTNNKTKETLVHNVA